MTAYQFLSGAEMEPIAIREALPEARFVARARVAVDGLTVAPVFASEIDGEVWGVLVDGGAADAGSTVPVTTDDGRTVEARVVESRLLDGEPESVLAAARYWELPPAYVARLKTALSATDEDPSDGN